MSDSSWAPFGPSGDDEDPPPDSEPVEEPGPAPAPVEEPPPAAEPEPVSFAPPVPPQPRRTPPAPPPVSSWPGAAPPAYGTTRRLAGNATASLVLGIVGLVLCPLVASVPAVVLGRRARQEIRERPAELSGESQATWGIALGWVGIAFGVLALVLIAVGASSV